MIKKRKIIVNPLRDDKDVVGTINKLCSHCSKRADCYVMRDGSKLCKDCYWG
jgi:hypothetical protein